MRVLFVCTANMCRSPLAAGLFVHAAHERKVNDALAASAGFLEGGRPVHEHVASILDDRGIDTSKKVSRKLSAELVEKSDLILTMTSEHARGVVGRFPNSIHRVYTFRHFASVVAPRATEITTNEWLTEVNRANRRAYLGEDEALDIADPIGRDFPVFVSLANELTNSISWILDCAFPAKARTA